MHSSEISKIRQWNKFHCQIFLISDKKILFLWWEGYQSQQYKCKKTCAFFLFYTKAFDRVKHEELFEILEKLDFHGKAIQIIHNLYREQAVCVWMGDKLSEYNKIERRVRQRCLFLLDLFKTYTSRWWLIEWN